MTRDSVWDAVLPDKATTRDLNQGQIYAWRKGIKTLYYIRIRQQALEGTEVAGCGQLPCCNAASPSHTAHTPPPTTQ